MKTLPIFFAVLALCASSIAAQNFGCPERNYSCQLAAVRKALEADPKNPENYYNVALVFQRSGNHEFAIEGYTMYISIPGVKKENLADGYNNRGISYRRLGKADLAFADFSKAFQLVPTNASFIANRGNANLDLKKYDEASADYAAAIKLDPRHALAYSSRAHLHMAHNKPDDAISDFTKALELDPSNPEPYYNRAVVYNSKREFAKALADYDKYIPAMQGNAVYQADGHINRGIIHAQLGNRDDALRDFTKVIELRPDYPNGYRARAMLYREMNQTKLAEADEQKAAQLSKK